MLDPPFLPGGNRRRRDKALQEIKQFWAVWEWAGLAMGWGGVVGLSRFWWHNNSLAVLRSQSRDPS